MSFGRTVLGTSGRPVSITADGSPEWKLGGITIDWSTVTAVTGSDETLDDGTVVKVGEKYLRYGTVMILNASSDLWEPAGSGDTLVNGETAVLNETRVVDSGGVLQSDNVGAIEGGRVWQDRLNVDTSDSPDLADLLAALPRLQMVVN